jgi:hypothetical protein
MNSLRDPLRNHQTISGTPLVWSVLQVPIVHGISARVIFLVHEELRLSVGCLY